MVQIKHRLFLYTMDWSMQFNILVQFPNTCEHFNNTICTQLLRYIPQHDLLRTIASNTLMAHLQPLRFRLNARSHTNVQQLCIGSPDSIHHNSIIWCWFITIYQSDAASANKVHEMSAFTPETVSHTHAECKALFQRNMRIF